MIFGFTGTSQGMAPRQLKTVRKLLYNVDVLHLGDCVGADTEVHEMAVLSGIKTVGHPPSDGHKRSFLEYDEEHEPKPYLKRNWDIARDGKDGLIAAPPNFIEIIRGVGAGTWSTIRYARKLGRKIWIVLSDGTVREE